MSISILSGARRRVAASVVIVALAAFLGFTSQPQAAHATPLASVSVSSNGGIFAGLNPQPITLNFTTATAMHAAQNGIISIEFNTFFPESSVPDTSNSYTPIASGGALTFSADNGVSLSTSEFRTYMSMASAYGYWYLTVRPNVDVPAGTTISVTMAANSISFPAGFGPYVNVSTYESAQLDSGQAQVSLMYHIAYDANGGSGTMNSVAADASTPVSASSFTRTGYTFGNWNTAPDGTGQTKYPNNGNYLYSDTTLYAVWWPDSHLVTFDQNDGSGNTTSQWGNYDVSAALDPNPFSSSAGHFAGWATSPNGPAAYDDGDPFLFHSDTTLYAVWVASQTVAFDSNGGTGSMSDQTASAAESLHTLAFERAGYGFTGWNTAANGSGTAYANGASFPFSASTTLYAQWRALPATPTASVDIQVPVGGTVANAPVALDVDGLKDQTGYTVTVHSTPQIIDQGIIWSGRLNKAVTLPAGLESGWHRLVIDGTAADGSAFTETYFFKVSESGTLLETSASTPAELTAAGLASTGANSDAAVRLIASLLVLGSAFIAFAMMRRREV